MRLRVLLPLLILSVFALLDNVKSKPIYPKGDPLKGKDINPNDLPKGFWDKQDDKSMVNSGDDPKDKPDSKDVSKDESWKNSPVKTDSKTESKTESKTTSKDNSNSVSADSEGGIIGEQENAEGSSKSQTSDLKRQNLDDKSANPKQKVSVTENYWVGPDAEARSRVKNTEKVLPANSNKWVLDEGKKTNDVMPKQKVNINNNDLVQDAGNGAEDSKIWGLQEPAKIESSDGHVIPKEEIAHQPRNKPKSNVKVIKVLDKLINYVKDLTHSVKVLIKAQSKMVKAIKSSNKENSKSLEKILQKVNKQCSPVQSKPQPITKPKPKSKLNISAWSGKGGSQDIPDDFDPSKWDTMPV